MYSYIFNHDQVFNLAYKLSMFKFSMPFSDYMWFTRYWLGITYIFFIDSYKLKIKIKICFA